MSTIDKRPRSWEQLAAAIYPDLVEKQPEKPSSVYEAQKRLLGLVRKEPSK